MLFWHDSQIDHLRPSDVFAPICLDGQHDVHFVAQQRRTSFRCKRGVSVMPFVCELEKSEMKLCVQRCTMWKAHQVNFQWHGRAIVSDHLLVRKQQTRADGQLV